MGDMVDRAIYDAAHEMSAAIQQLSANIIQVRDQLEEIWKAIEGCHREMKVANDQVKELRL